MTNEQKNNLVALALALDAPLPAGITFDMSDFQVKHECGTAACAVGYAAILFKRTAYDGYFMLSKELFGLDVMKSPDNEIWSWLFSGAWTLADNTKEGAAARIRWFLRNGLPADAGQQRYGEAPLCYREGGMKEGAILT